MFSAIWGDPKPTSDEQYPLKLLKGLLQDMLKQVQAYGACLALYDESINQMVVRLHMRRSGQEENEDELALEVGNPHARLPLRRNTMKLADKPTPFPDVPKSQGRDEERFVIVATTRETALLPPGSSYPPGQDMIGVTWRHNQSYHFSHEQYQALRLKAHQSPVMEAFTPSWYLTLPLKEPEQAYEDVDLRYP